MAEGRKWDDAKGVVVVEEGLVRSEDNNSKTKKTSDGGCKLGSVQFGRKWEGGCDESESRGFRESV